MSTAFAPSAAIVPPLLVVDEHLTLADSKTVLSFPFTVPEGTRALELQLDWSPRFCRDQEYNQAAVRSALAEWRATRREGVSDAEALPEAAERFCNKIANLLNVVLVDPDGRWRGRTDRGRGSREPLVVSEEAVPLGFIPGPLTPGRWSAELEVHFVGPPGCEISMTITPTEVPSTSSPGDSPVVVDAMASGPGWYRGELHSHSEHSDGAYPVGKLLDRAQDLGLDFLALTDHNTLAGRRDLPRHPLPTILGVELTTFYGHHVVLGAREMVPWHEGGEVRDVNEVIREFRAQGALFTLTHPFHVGDPLCTGCRWTTPHLDPADVDLVEIWHREWRGGFGDNLSAYALWDELWHEGHRPVAIGVRDWHGRPHEAPLPGPLPTTAIQSRSLGAEDLLDGLRHGRAYVTSGPELQVELETVDGTLWSLGDRSVASPGPVTVRCAVGGLDPGVSTEMRLLRCGTPVAVTPLDGDGDVQFTDLEGGPGWYRVEIWSGEQPLAITNHIELTA